MTLNFLGVIAAITAFLSIWVGHVSVRKIEAISPVLWPPTVIFVLLGLGLETLALASSSLALATVCGILGITALWDALELTRQEHRIRRGHAPANPQNPRHAAILAEPGSRAVTIDLLNRNPIGRPVADPAEAVRLASHH